MLSRYIRSPLLRIRSQTIGFGSYRRVLSTTLQTSSRTSFRTRPFLFSTIFVVVNKTLIGVALIPAYYVFDFALLDPIGFLDGPVVTWVLKLPLLSPGAENWRFEDLIQIGFRQVIFRIWWNLFGGTEVERVEERLKGLVNLTAGYVLVKLLFPIRWGLSLSLTPKVVRAFVWRR
ncbi:hypothetical protein DL96DRAFT_299593 [Flagelloscypha sp. PMI_526]|nr:hypothetical protein DL96DRAFT_299593 [Flagelloscypha sp. PMI_526]